MIRFGLAPATLVTCVEQKGITYTKTLRTGILRRQAPGV